MKMYKKIGWVLCFVMLFLSIVGVNADTLNASDLSDEPYVYAVEPGTDEWFNLSVDERIAVASVDESILKNMTTRALVVTVVTNPYIVNVYAFGDVNDGIDIVRQSCVPLQYLLLRQDAFDKLQEFLESGNSDALQYNVAYDLAQYIKPISGGISLQSLINPITGGREETVYTPKGFPVIVYRNLDWKNHQTTRQQVLNKEKEFAKLYNIKKVGAENPAYNCHSYAWYSQRSNNNVWMDNPSRYMTEKSYILSTGKSGDKITYKRKDGTIDHSGIMKSKTVVISKWGCMGLFEHTVKDCPYYVVRGANNIEYWRRNK